MRYEQEEKIILAVVIIIAAAAVAVGFFLKSKLGKSSSGGDAAYVESVQSLVNGVNGGGQNRYMGIVESQDTWDVNLTSDQTVKEIFVSVGDEVQEGTPLFEYKTDDLSLQIAQAKLELESIANQITDYNNQIKTLTAEKMRHPRMSSLIILYRFRVCRLPLSSLSMSSRAKN